MEKRLDKVEEDVGDCNERGIRLDERTQEQERKIGKHGDLISDMYDYKNDIYRKITELRERKVDRETYNKLAKCVTQLKTEKKFIPWAVMIVSALCAIAAVVLMIL